MKSEENNCTRCLEPKACLEFDLFIVEENKEVKRYFCKECLTKIVQSWNFGGHFY